MYSSKYSIWYVCNHVKYTFPILRYRWNSSWSSCFRSIWGALIGGCTNLVLGVISGPTNIPFALVNIVLGLIVGFVARKKGFGYREAILTGLLLSVVCPLIGTPISVLLFGGLSGSGADFLVGFLVQSGQKIFTSAFIPRILTNIIDKPLSCVMVVYFLSKMPRGFIYQFNKSPYKNH
ncbi:membrane protein [[Clostridium] sordellii]|nr:membrane protein [[Clostridium] sordellii] [Paeniclostridium sordellii]